MRQEEYERVLQHATRRAIAAGRPELTPAELLDVADQGELDLRAMLIDYLDALDTALRLQSRDTEDAIVTRIQEVLVVDSPPMEGILLETDRFGRSALGERERVRLPIVDEAAEIAPRIRNVRERLIGPEGSDDVD